MVVHVSLPLVFLSLFFPHPHSCGSLPIHVFPSLTFGLFPLPFQTFGFSLNLRVISQPSGYLHLYITLIESTSYYMTILITSTTVNYGFLYFYCGSLLLFIVIIMTISRALVVPIFYYHTYSRILPTIRVIFSHFLHLLPYSGDYLSSALVSQTF